MNPRLKRFARHAVGAGAALLLASAATSKSAVDLESIGSPVQAAPVDPVIAQAIAQISPEQIRRTIQTLVGFGTRNSLSSMATDLPAGQGINAAADWIESELQRYAAACHGCLEVKRDSFTESAQDRIPQPTTITNLYAVLRGSDPAQTQRVYIVSGHYDSRISDVLDAHGAAPGANDDASGVAVSLECARVLSGLKPSATLVFAIVAAEEQGLNGSRHLAKLAKAQGWDVEGVLSNDIVGGNTTPGDIGQNKSLVRVFSEGTPAAATPEQLKLIVSLGYESDSPSRELARALLDVSATYAKSLRDFHPVLEFRRDRFLRGGDHTSFNEEGFPAVRFTEWREDFNHQHQNLRIENGVEYGDLLKFVDVRYVSRVATVNAAALATFAYAPPAPVKVRVLTKALDNNTTLEWEPGVGAAADTQYEVLWRELSAPQWQRFVNVKALAPSQGVASAPVGRATVPISKDNVILGVRAADARGHRSPAVVPWPVR